MSTSPTTPEVPTRSSEEVEITVVSHSNMFYWWPVWAVGLLMALLTWIDGHYAVIVPPKSDARRNWRIEVSANQYQTREGVILAEGEHLLPDQPKDNIPPEPIQPYLHMARSKSYGVIFAVTLILVILITNVPLRGMWSVIIIVVLVMSTVILFLAGWMDNIVEAFRVLHIYINAAGYLFISLVLLAIWVVTFIFFDRQMYMIFTPGQLKVCTEIGGGEKAYDTTGMTIEKQRSDLFRHWILGLGSGDLIVRTAGAHSDHFELHNVLFVGSKVQQIEDMLRERAVVRGR